MENENNILFVYMPVRKLSSDEIVNISIKLRKFFNKKIGYDPKDNIPTYDELMRIVDYVETKDFGIKMCRKVVEIYQDNSKHTLIRVKMGTRKDSLLKALEIFIDENFIE